MQRAAASPKTTDASSAAPEMEKEMRHQLRYVIDRLKQAKTEIK